MKKLTGAVLLLLLVAGCATSAQIHGAFAKAKERAVRNNLPIVFMPHGQEPNSAGGVTIDIDFQNVSNKTIRSIVFTVIPYDENGNQVTGEKNKKSATELTTSGYFRADNAFYSRSWEDVWYSTTIKYVKVSAVAITYLDDATKIIDNPDDLYKMAIHADTKSFIYWWSGYPIGSKPVPTIEPASPAPLRSEPIQ